jgi:hypothetical protein
MWWDVNHDDDIDDDILVRHFHITDPERSLLPACLTDSKHCQILPSA